MITYRLTDDLTHLEPKPVTGADVVREWLRIALMTTRGEQPYLHPKYGIDMIQILRSNDPLYYFEQSIRETVSLRESLRHDVQLISCTCWQNSDGSELYAELECRTDEGDFKLNTSLDLK